MTITAAKLMVYIGGDASGAQKAMQGASKGLDAFASRANRIGNTLSLAVTAPLILLAKKSLDVAAAFDRNMNVLQETSNATAAELQALDDEAKALGADLSLPGTSAADAAEAMLELSKAGLEVNDVLQGSRGVLQMAAAGQLSNAQAATIAANAMNAFGLAGDETVRVADLLAASANASSAEISDMADALKMSSAVFASAKIPIEDLVTVIAEMANAGIQGSDAGTSLKQMMLSLQAPSAKAAGIMRELGISVYDSQGNLLSMEGIIGQFENALGGLTQEQRNAALAVIFGSDAVRAANVVLMGGVDRFNEMKDAVTEQGAAADLAAAQNKGLGGVFDKIKSAAESAMLAGIEPLEDDIVNLADKIAQALVKFSELDEGTLDLTVKLGLMALAAGPVMKGLGWIASAGSGVIGMLGKLTPMILESTRAWQAGLTLQTALEAGFGSLAVTLGTVAVALAAVVAVAWQWNEQIVKTNEEGQKAVDNAWAQFFDNQVESGKNAYEVLQAYNDRLDALQKKLEELPPWLRIFILNQDELTDNQTALNFALVEASGSYREYADAAVKAGLETQVFSQAEYDSMKNTEAMAQANEDLATQLLNTSDGYNAYVQAMTEAGLLLMVVTEDQYNAAKAADAVAEGTQAAAEGVAELSAAAMEASDILSGLDSALQDAGWSAEEAEAAHNRLAIALGELDPAAAQAQSDMGLLSQAFAAGVIAESAYTDAALRAKEGVEVLSNAERQAVQTALDHARALEEAARAAEAATLRQIEMAQQMSEMWSRAFDSYQSGVDRLLERQSEINGRIAELQQKLRQAQKSGDKDAVRNYKQQIAELRGEAAETSKEVGKLADEMQRTIDAAIASAAIQELQRMYEEGKITFEEYVSGLTGIQESFGLTNEAGIGIAAGIAAISGAVETGKLPVDQYDEAMKFLAQDASDGQIDLEKLNEWIGTVAGTATETATQVTQGMDDAEKAMEGAATTAETTASEIEKTFTSVDWVEVGRMIGEGIAQGINESAQDVADAAANAAEGASGGVSDELEMRSPSRVMYRHGVNAMEGLKLGVIDSAKDVISAVMAIAGDMARVTWLVPGIGSESWASSQGNGPADSVIGGSGEGTSPFSTRPGVKTNLAGNGQTYLTVNIDGRSVKEVMLNRLNEELA